MISPYPRRWAAVLAALSVLNLLTVLLASYAAGPTPAASLARFALGISGLLAGLALLALFVKIRP